MKTVVSTKELTRVIRKAIKLRCETFEINTETNELVFNKKHDLCIDIEYAEYEGCTNKLFTFDAIQMCNVLTFLKGLQEQPIVIKLEQFEEDKLSIELSQFACSF